MIRSGKGGRRRGSNKRSATARRKGSTLRGASATRRAPHGTTPGGTASTIIPETNVATTGDFQGPNESDLEAGGGLGSATEGTTTDDTGATSGAGGGPDGSGSESAFSRTPVAITGVSDESPSGAPVRTKGPQKKRKRG